MKTKIAQIIEALTPNQRDKVDKWKRGDTSFSDHLFAGSNDKDRVLIDLDHPSIKSEHQNRIEDHLKSNGFTDINYHEGHAKDKYGRPTKIGKALVKTKAPKNMLDGFNTDPARQQKSAISSDYKVLITRHPHDVAGMTSKGQSWENESCMNFHDGSNKDYLKMDVKHGTHVAYLVHKNDVRGEKPLARIALKPFISEDDQNDVVLRPEQRVYGDAPDAFTHTVNKFLNKHFPGGDAVYRKHDSVYHDTGNRWIFGSPESANKVIDDYFVKKSDDASYTKAMAALKSKHATKEKITQAIDSDNFTRKAFSELLAESASIKDSKVDESHLEQMLNKITGMRSIITSSNPFTGESTDDKDYMMAQIVRHPRVTRSILDTAYEHARPKKGKYAATETMGSVLKHHMANKGDVDKIVEDIPELSDREQYQMTADVSRSPYFDKEHVTKLLDNQNFHLGIASNSTDFLNHFDISHLRQVMNRDNLKKDFNPYKSEHAKIGILTKMYNADKIHPEHMDVVQKAIDDWQPTVKNIGLDMRNRLQIEQMRRDKEKEMKKSNKEIAESSILYSILTEKVLSIGLNPAHETFRTQHRDEMHDMLRNAYVPVGGYGKLGSGTEEESNAIYADIDSSIIKATKRNGKISAINLYKPKFGRKSIATAHDGSIQGKKDIKKTKIEDNDLQRAWGEVSDVPEIIAKKMGIPPVPASRAAELLNKQVELDPDNEHYYREIGGKKTRKIIVGYPK